MITLATKGRQGRLDSQPQQSLVPWRLRNLQPLARACLTFGTTATKSLDTEDSSALDALPVVLAGRFSALALPLLLPALHPSANAARIALLARARLDALRTMAVIATAAPALRCLSSAAIPFVVIKGPAVARFHPQPTSRPFGDLDVLVPRSRFQDAAAILHGLGFRQPLRTRPPWNWFDPICREGENFHRPDGANIDLHHCIAPWVFAKEITFQGLLARSEHGHVAGAAVRFPSIADCLVVSALHLINDLGKADASLMSWRDVIILSELLGTQATRKAFANAGLAWFAPYILTTTAYLKTQTLPPDSPPAERHPLRAASQRARLRLLGWDRDTLIARHPIVGVVRLPAPRALAFLAGSVVPSPCYVRTKHGGYVSYWRKAERSVFAVTRGADFRVEDITTITGATPNHK